MFYRCAREYIIAYKLKIHKKTLVVLDIDLLNHIYVERIYNMVKDLNNHRCMLDFDSLFLNLILK